MSLRILAQQIVAVIQAPGGWLIPVALIAGALGGYTFTFKRALDRALDARESDAVNLDEERRRRAELNVAIAMGQKVRS